MLSKTLVLLTLTSATLGAPQNVEDLLPSGVELSGDLGAAATSVFNFFGSIPTLADNVYSVLETAIPEADLTKTDFQCEPTAASWYSDLPKDVQAALTSYASAIQTWAAEHASELSEIGAATEVPSCSKAIGSITSSEASSTGTASVTGSGTIASVTGTGTGTGTAAGEAGASVTRSGTAGAASSSQFLGAAPRATGVIVGSVAGIVGALGVMAML